VAVEDQLAWPAPFRVVLLSPAGLLTQARRAGAVDFLTLALEKVVDHQHGVAGWRPADRPTDVLLYPREAFRSPVDGLEDLSALLSGMSLEDAEPGLHVVVGQAVIAQGKQGKPAPRCWPVGSQVE
jgi:hypothetical protein